MDVHQTVLDKMEWSKEEGFSVQELAETAEQLFVCPECLGVVEFRITLSPPLSSDIKTPLGNFVFPNGHEVPVIGIERQERKLTYWYKCTNEGCIFSTKGHTVNCEPPLKVSIRRVQKENKCQEQK